MPKRRSTPIALSQHRLITLGYTRIIGMEYARGKVKWDMGGVVDQPFFRDDGAPKLHVPAGIWDIEMESVMGVSLAVQCTARSALASRVAKAKDNPHYRTCDRAIEFWGWETTPQADGGYRLRIVDPKTGRDEVTTFYPVSIQPSLIPSPTLPPEIPSPPVTGEGDGLL